MESRGFDDWSPASVFGATTKRRDAVEKLAHEDTRRVGEDNNKVVGDKSQRDTLGSPEEDEHDRAAREDDAARVLQKHLRVWRLYRREIESLEQVEQLRHELEVLSAQTIIEWARRTQQRRAIVRYADQCRHRQSEAKREAGRCLVRWLYWQRCIAQAKRSLQQRIAARRRLVCWWRRVLLTRRCDVRRAKRDAFTHANAARVMRRFVAKAMDRRNAIQTGRERIRAFMYCVVLQRRAQVQLSRRRSEREAVRSLQFALHRACIRQTLIFWREHTNHQREAELRRRHNAACVLQRLVRVVLTAFRLMRRRHAATRIQSLVRARRAQQICTRMRLERRRRAAMTIQRIARGWAARRQFTWLLRQLRERFRCQNCGLIEPGGLYCKFCGRRRTTFEGLGASDVATGCTTEARLRKKRRKASGQETRVPLPPPAPPIGGRQYDHRQVHVSTMEPNVLLMGMPDIAPPSPTQNSMLRSSQRIGQDMSLTSPIRPRKPKQMRVSSGRPSVHHRSLSLTHHHELSLPSMGVASADKTRQRAETLLQREFGDHSAAMELHLKRLQKGSKAASR